MKQINKTFFAEWDKEYFVLPDNFKLNKTSNLGDALQVFYLAGGYDFFEIFEAEQYSQKWLDFVGDLYSAIEDNVYTKENGHFKFPFSEEMRNKLIQQGIPAVFTTDF